MRYFCGHSARRKIRSSPRTRTFESLEPRIALSGTPPTAVEVEVASTAWSSGFVSYLNSQGLGDDGYRIPVGSSAQTAPLPWNNLDQIRITFSEDVDVQAADLSLSGIDTTSFTFSEFFYDPQRFIATWTLAAPIAKDRLQIDLDASGIDPIRDLDGNILDGEWTNNVDTFASGDGSAGGDFEFLFNVLPGDVNASGQVTYLDYIYVRQQEGKSTVSPGYNAKYDVDGSGLIDATDWQDVLARAWQSLPTGNPAGVGNDAPTADQFDLVSITDDAVDVAISLLTGFADAEDGASGLTYTIKGVSETLMGGSGSGGGQGSWSLFDSVGINQSTGALVVNAKAAVSGRAVITVSATDSGGISTDTTISVDVNYVNQPPLITEFLAEQYPGNSWIISGRVSDPDDDTVGWIVEFYGVFDTRAAVWPDGRFEFAVTLDPGVWGWESAVTWDPHGLQSNIPSVFVGLT